MVSERIAVEEMRLGGLAATEATSFVKEPNLTVDWQGNIYARTETEIRLFRSDGLPLTTLGGRGDGPGEFRSAFDHGLLGDTLWVIDPLFSPSRITLFLKDGTLLGTFVSKEQDFPEDESRSWRVTHLLQGGQILVVANSNPGVRPRPNRVRIPIAVSDSDISDPRIIARIEWPQGLFIPDLVQAGEGPFPSSPLFSVFPDGSGVVQAIWQNGRPGLVKVRMYDVHGTREFEVVHTIPQTPVPGRVADSLVTDGVTKLAPIIERRRARGLPVPSDPRNAVEEGLRIPRAFPAFEKIVTGLDGSIWLKRMRSFSDNTWFVLDFQGTPAFTVEFPPGVNIQQASFDHVWATALGEYDAPLVLRYAIEKD